MDGNTREFVGIVSGVDASTVYGMNGPVSAIDPKLDVDMLGGGSLIGLRFADDVADASALLGRKVRVTVEVLEEGER